MDNISTRFLVLVLNQNYQPLNICNVRRAVVLLDRGKAELLLYGTSQIHTPYLTLQTPSVIRMGYLVRRPILQRRLSRREVFYRDNLTCQYCGHPNKSMTLDHVIPRVRGGSHIWENVVTACIQCNHRKANRTPKEAGMILLRDPRAPKPNPYDMFYKQSIEKEWVQFMPWISKD